ncbi:protease inhibitor I42 family protein [Bacillus cereus]|uniref:protease inhibitor I42 family protein n=1 Tax=Bacillus cereus TaxID=1396 RepID=UPI000994B9F5|nr:protease inhibitor I42 family protein [Bacillus cereus]OPA10889.1 hypothetical protein BHL54_21040 [Bacillus cereus]
MKAFKTVSSFVLAGMIGASSLAVMPVQAGATSVSAIQNMQHLGESPYSAVFTEESNNRTFFIKKGNTFAIRLHTQPTSGYAWTLDPIKQYISSIKDYLESVDPVPDATGFSGNQVFVFKADDLGMTQIKLKYDRPWENIPAKEYSININVIN